MIVKFVEASDMQDTKGLTLNKEYEAYNCYIYDWYSQVYLVNDDGIERGYNSVLFGDEFSKELNKAIKYFDKHEDDYRYGIFIREYY